MWSGKWRLRRNWFGQLIVQVPAETHGRSPDAGQPPRWRDAAADDLLAGDLADLVCHEDQLNVWAQEAGEELTPHLKEPRDYEETLAINRSLKAAIRHVVSAAFTHPALPRLSVQPLTSVQPVHGGSVIPVGSGGGDGSSGGNK